MIWHVVRDRGIQLLPSPGRYHASGAAQRQAVAEVEHGNNGEQEVVDAIRVDGAGGWGCHAELLPFPALAPRAQGGKFEEA